MSDQLNRRIIEDIDRIRRWPVVVTTPSKTLGPIDDMLRAKGFRPARLGRNRTDFAPVARPSNTVFVTDPANPKGYTRAE